MDGLRPALFGLFLLSFAVSKPVGLLHHHQTFPSSESSESNEWSSSEEVTITRTSHPTMRPDSLEDERHETNHTTAHPGLNHTTPDFMGQTVVINLETSPSPLQVVQVTVEPDAGRVTTTELRCYTIPLTSPEPKPARGDAI